MSHKESTKAFPDQQYNGSAEGCDNYDADKLSWAITSNYDEHLESVDASTIPRVDAAYTVPANDNDNPHGPPGTHVPRETQAAYDRRIAKDKKDGKTIWAGGLRGMKDDARESFLATEQSNARAAFAKVEENHGNQTEKQVSTLVRKFNTTNKKRNQTIENFNDDWRRGLRAMKSNAMELPPKYVVNLYLAALGSPYKTLESMIQVLPSTQRTISKVMQLAKDHIVEDNDEADVNMAMAAKHKRKYHESAYAAQQQKRRLYRMSPPLPHPRRMFQTRRWTGPPHQAENNDNSICMLNARSVRHRDFTSKISTHTHLHFPSTHHQHTSITINRGNNNNYHYHPSNNQRTTKNMQI